MKQKNRNEIKIEDTWDLTYIFKSKEEFDNNLKLTKNLLPKISEYKGKLLESDKSLLSFLELSDELERKLYKLYYYAHLSLDVDTTNTLSQEMEGKVSNLLQEYSVLSSFVIPELLKSNYDVVLDYINKNSELEKYRFNLECIYRYQKHSLNEEMEKLLSTISKSFIADDTFEALTDADMTFPNILDISNLISFI